MKNLFLIVFYFLIAMHNCSAWAQKELTDKKTHYYTFTIYNTASDTVVSFEENHPLSNLLNSSWNLFNINYRHVYEVSTGFSGQTVEILKPAIYNAVIKVDKFIRKAVDKGDFDKEEAIAVLKHIFDCANALVTESDTQAFEKEIASMKNPESIIHLFNRIVIEYV